MRILQRRSYRFAAQLVLCIIALGITANLTLNLHFHRLDNGAVVVHAHPYDSETPLHNHSSSEVVILQGMMLLDQLISPLTLSPLAYALVAERIQRLQWAEVTEHLILSLRAPPTLAA